MVKASGAVEKVPSAALPSSTAPALVLSCFLLLGCNIQTGKNHYILAERLFNDHKYKVSVDEFQKIIDEDPQSVLAEQALYRIAMIQYLYLRNYQAALTYLAQFASSSKNNELIYQAIKTMAEIYFSKIEDFKKAQEQYQGLLKKYPESKERDFFLLREAKSFYGKLDFLQAIATYEQLIQEHPTSSLVPETLYQIGNIYYTKGDHELAIKAFKRVIILYPQSPQAVFSKVGIGSCYEEMDQLDKALEEYNKVLNLYPSKAIIEAKIARLNQRQFKSVSKKNEAR